MAKKNNDDRVVATLDGDGMRNSVLKRTAAAAKKEWAAYQKSLNKKPAAKKTVRKSKKK